MNEVIKGCTVEDLISKSEISAKKDYIQSKKIAREYEKEVILEQEEETVKSLTTDQLNDVFASFEAAIQSQYIATHKSEKDSLQNAVPFIDKVFDEKFRLVPKQLVTVAAYTGSGKSTTTVNVAAEYIRAGKRAFIISNEEQAKDMYDMVACILEGVDHGLKVNQLLTPEEEKRVIQRFKTLIKEKQLFIIDGELSNNGTTKSDYILDMIKGVDSAAIKPDIIIIDYLTNIYSMGSNSQDNHYFQLERFLSELKNMINTISFPVMMCAQMHSDDKKKGSKSLDTKIVMGGSVLRYSTIVIEAKTDFDTKITTYTIHKNRRFKKKGDIKLVYDKGRMIPYTDAYAAQIANQLTNQRLDVLSKQMGTQPPESDDE